MAALRTLFQQHGLLESADADALRHRPGHDPWSLRVDALSRVLTGPELAVALGHIARHRGFRSNSKQDAGKNAPSDTSAMLKAVAETTDRLEGRTVAQFAAADWTDRKRNRGAFDRTVLRADLESESRQIFEAQLRLGNPLICDDLRTGYAKAFDQRCLADSQPGQCNHEPAELRTSKRAPSFELFRLLGRLSNLRLLTADGPLPLTPEQIGCAADGFGQTAKLTFKTVRTRLDLGAGVRFDGVSPADEKNDVASRTGNGADGTYALRKALEENGWRALQPFPSWLDQAAEILTFRQDLTRIADGLRQTGMPSWCADRLIAAAGSGRFAAFRGAAHVSAKVAQAVNAGLRQGLAVHEAFKAAGYDPTARSKTDLETIGNPVARKALGQMLKQIRTVIHEHKPLFGPLGLPDRIHVELARDIGKGQDERDKMTDGLKKRTAARERLRNELQEQFAGRDVRGEDILRYELWKEQGGRCIYSDTVIPLTGVLAADNSYQVDHILPWARFGDDSYRNKTLCTASANQDKKGRTPFEWLKDDPAAWKAFAARVEGCKTMAGGKKGGHYLRQNAAEVEERFRTRNLNDTRYACRLLLDALTRLYPDDEGTKRVYARPGALTSKLRQGWGLEGRKKGQDGKRLADDRHHALDAMVVAACSEPMLQQMTKRVQQAEQLGQRRPFADLPLPWPGFREQVHAALDQVMVARPERHRARGEAHDATTRQVRERGGRVVVYERKAVKELTLKDLDRVKDLDRNAATAASLRHWIEAGKPTNALPCSPKGDVIRKVRIEASEKVAVRVRGGTAGRGKMARIDVFREDRPGKAARFHLVPIYPHQVADPDQVAPPNLAVVADEDEHNWTLVDDFIYLFSLHHNSFVEVVKKGGEVSRGYLKGFNRNNGKLKLATMLSQQDLLPGIGSKTLLILKKLSVDRMGRICEITSEKRTWRGVVCT